MNNLNGPISLEDVGEGSKETSPCTEPDLWPRVAAVLLRGAPDRGSVKHGIALEC